MRSLAEIEKEQVDLRAKQERHPTFTRHMRLDDLVREHAVVSMKERLEKKAAARQP